MHAPAPITETPLRARACPHCGSDAFLAGAYCWRCRPKHICSRCYIAPAMPGKLHQMCEPCAEIDKQITDECRRDAERDAGWIETLEEAMERGDGYCGLAGKEGAP